MSAIPAPSLYHRSVGWHAPAMRRALIVTGIGLVVALAMLAFMPWELAATTGWNAAALAFLSTVWPIIRRADGSLTQGFATRDDETHGSARVLLLSASVASLFGVGSALGRAGTETGGTRLALIADAILTVVLSWAVINTVYTLRYAHLHFDSATGGIVFGDSDEGPPDYRDFAYVAFTIGMTYQVSDTTVRNGRIRPTVLGHAVLSYVFGVVIVAGAINLVAGLIR
jgi:uncharacterized membrane protein